MKTLITSQKEIIDRLDCWINKITKFEVENRILVLRNCGSRKTFFPGILDDDLDHNRTALEDVFIRDSNEFSGN